MAITTARANSKTAVLPKGNTSPLGATVSPGGVNFSVFARDCSGVELLLFDNAGDSIPSRVIPLDPGSFTATVSPARTSRNAGAVSTRARS